MISAKVLRLSLLLVTLLKDQWNISNLIIGLFAAAGFFIWGYVVDGGFHND